MVFMAGVKATDPEIEVLVTYIVTFSDVALAAETAQTQISAGADVLTGTAQMVVGASAKSRMLAAIGLVRKPIKRPLPDAVVASQVYHWEVILKELISLRSKASLADDLLLLILRNGGEVMAFNPDLEIPAEVKDAAESTIQSIIDGSITIELPRCHSKIISEIF